MSIEITNTEVVGAIGDKTEPQFKISISWSAEASPDLSTIVTRRAETIGLHFNGIQLGTVKTQTRVVLSLTDARTIRTLLGDALDIATAGK